jgi:hypothetical protein
MARWWPRVVTRRLPPTTAPVEGPSRRQDVPFPHLRPNIDGQPCQPMTKDERWLVIQYVKYLQAWWEDARGGHVPADTTATAATAQVNKRAADELHHQQTGPHHEHGAHGIGHVFAAIGWFMGDHTAEHRQYRTSGPPLHQRFFFFGIALGACSSTPCSSSPRAAWSVLAAPRVRGRAFLPAHRRGHGDGGACWPAQLGVNHIWHWMDGRTLDDGGPLPL